MTQEDLKEFYVYKDGWLFYKKNLKNGCKRGDKLLGHVDKLGYRIASFKNKANKYHRLVFLWHHGFLPNQIDHIDRNKTNNNIENLREASPSQNMANVKHRRTDKSPYKGVHFHIGCCKFIANIRVNGKAIHLGYYSCPIAAAKEYDKKAKELFGGFACTNF